MTPAIPAATLILWRDRPGGGDVLLVERAPTLAFAAGALVFPGGRIDPGDRALAAAMGDDDLAPRLAAIRETIEEAGVAIGVDGDVAAMRARLAAGATIGDLGSVDPAALVPYARWRPEHLPVRVFDTHFYLTIVANHVPDPQVDATENVRAFWAAPRDVLDAADRGEAVLLFPTRRVLERLATHADGAAALAAARRWPVRTITPWIEARDDSDWLRIPDDLGYPVTAERLDRATRG